MKKAGREARKTRCARRPWNPTVFRNVREKDGVTRLFTLSDPSGLPPDGPLFWQNFSTCHQALHPLAYSFPDEEPSRIRESTTLAAHFSSEILRPQLWLSSWP